MGRFWRKKKISEVVITEEPRKINMIPEFKVGDTVWKTSYYVEPTDIFTVSEFKIMKILVTERGVSYSNDKYATDDKFVEEDLIHSIEEIAEIFNILSGTGLVKREPRQPITVNDVHVNLDRKILITK